MNTILGTVQTTRVLTIVEKFYFVGKDVFLRNVEQLCDRLNDALEAASDEVHRHSLLLQCISQLSAIFY